MNKYVIPPCNSSLATPCAKSVMASSCGEGKPTALFAKGVSSFLEGELAFDENASTVSLAPNICVDPGVSLAVQEGEECSEELVDNVIGEESAARHFGLEREADDNDSFVDIKSGITAVGDAESKDWTFEDALPRATLSLETLAEGVVDTSRLPAMLVFFLHCPLDFSLQE